MALNYDKLINWPIPEAEQQLTRRDTILYALGIGLGAEPCDPHQLRFVYEDGLQALPQIFLRAARCADLRNSHPCTIERIIFFMQ